MKHSSKVPGYYFVEFALLRILVFLLSLFPLESLDAFIQTAAAWVYRASPKRRQTALANLDLAFKDTKSQEEKERIALASFQHAALAFLEFLTIEKRMNRAPTEHFEFSGTEHLDQAFSRGKGIIFVISHLGSWEYLAFLPFLRSTPCSVVVRPIKNPYVYRWVQRLRRATKLNPIDKNKSVKEILHELKSNHLVAILIDQWAGNDGIWVDFFGKATSTTSVPARLAKKYGAALVPARCLRTRAGHYKIMIEPAVEVSGGETWERDTTVDLNRWLEYSIRALPEQWIWSHRRWRAARKEPDKSLSHSPQP